MTGPSPHQRHKIAVVSDVHGNLPALEAVIEHARTQHVSAFWNLGDYLGYGPFVNEVVVRLCETCAAQVIGNYDLKVLKFSQKETKWRKSKKPEKFLAFKWAWETLSKENALRLDALPQNTLQSTGRLSVLLTHGGPASVDEVIGPETPLARMKALAGMTDANVVLCGHTHRPFMQTVGHTTFINPGSVGRPEGADPRAAYAILEVADGEFTVRFCRVDYDIERLCHAIHAAGLPEDFSTMFKSGNTLDQVQGSQAESVVSQSGDTDQTMADVYRFARQCRYEAGHAEQVMTLASILFGKLEPVHGLGAHELFLLRCAAILHDIGWIEGKTGHHKQSMRMILGERTLAFHDIDRTRVALIARYHRKALPKSGHPAYRDLPVDQQRQVKLLGGILRIADGLDRSHMSVVKDIDVRISRSVSGNPVVGPPAPRGRASGFATGKDGEAGDIGDYRRCSRTQSSRKTSRSKPDRIFRQAPRNLVEFSCQTRGPAEPEMLAADKKSDLFEKTTGCMCCFVCELSESQGDSARASDPGD